jgi:hypothetical protein
MLFLPILGSLVNGTKLRLTDGIRYPRVVIS